MKIQIALLAALLAAPAWAQQPPPTGESSTTQSNPDNMKGYGYGTQPGQESNAGAKQATKKSKSHKRSKAVQDEQGPAQSRAAEREGSAVGARSSTHAKSSASRAAKKKKKAPRSAAAADQPADSADRPTTSGQQRSDSTGQTAPGAAPTGR